MGEAEAGEGGALRLLLVGKSGGGKSATGNTLLGHAAFESRLQATATTRQCQEAQGSWNGRRVSVVDTPDILGSEASVEAQTRRCVELSRPGPHALLFVTQVGRFTAEDGQAARRVEKVFGAEAWRHTIILFTRKEDLGRISLENYVAQSGNEALRQLVGRCGGRVCAFNNRAVGAEREQQVSQLMRLVQGLVRENGGGCYSSRSATQRRTAAGSASSMTPLAAVAALVHALLVATVFVAAIAMALCRLPGDVLSCLKKGAAGALSWLHHKCSFLTYPVPSGDRCTDK